MAPTPYLDYMITMGHGCWNFNATTEYSNITKVLAAMGAVIEEEVEKIASKHIKIECSGAFNDDTTCACGTCNIGKGVSYNMCIKLVF